MANVRRDGREAVIVAAVRTACGKATKGTLRFTRPDTLGGAVIRDLFRRTPEADPAQVDDVIIGCAFPEASQGLNVARQCAVLGGLPDGVPAMTVNRFCSSGLQTIALAAERIWSGSAEVIVAGGVESMSLVPMGGLSFQPNPDLVEHRPEIYVSMGITAENVARQYGVSREDQDAFAYGSHMKAVKAIRDGVFKDQITPVEVTTVSWSPAAAGDASGASAASPDRSTTHSSGSTTSSSGSTTRSTVTFAEDEGPRADTTPEALAALKPVFRLGGTVTAGNSSQMNDAASAVLVMSRDRAERLGLKPMARFLGFDAAGVAPEIMGIGPVEAVPKLLGRVGVRLADIDLIELNEAFAAQALAVIRTLDMDPGRVNINGGAIAMGHPLGCTGAKLATQILHDMIRLDKRYGLVTMCVGGGMGAAGLFERLT